MNYWRMQLHPGGDSPWAMEYAVHSIGAGFIGLDFALTEDGNVVGDLLADNNQKISSVQENFVPFAKEMVVNDKVLIIVHHHPFAVVTVDSEYNYIRRTEPKLGVWFRHFRRIKDPIYFSDFVVGNKKWVRNKEIQMTLTIQGLVNTDTLSHTLIQDMIAWHDQRS
ncbi:MAG: hypothetical protein Q8Q54_02720 [Methylococcales bacterium]|nr:hypothetical protein [Methylococcales bacterium]MDP3837815.1 hypothetical protein [Methylococcales bacterium]